MRTLLAATCLTPVVLFPIAAPAAAETVISNKRTTPIRTSTDNDDIRIASDGSIKLTTGDAVTIDSNHDVRNQGTISITDSNDSTGILANTNLTSDITNTGTISIVEDYNPKDTDDDGDRDGPFARGRNRFGIHVLGGGTFTGAIKNSGTITVEGNESAGIAIDSNLQGSLTNTGHIGVIGDNSYGIRAQDVSGDVNLTKGSVSVKGANSVAVELNGDIGGALVVQSSLSSTGYRSTSAPKDTSDLDSDDLLQGGSALVIKGNVAKGILFDARPADKDEDDDDEDNDGIKDTQESTANITTFGSAAAVRIGSTTEDITIGAVASSKQGHGIVIKGNVAGHGVYEGVSATGMAIGGTGRKVSIAGGMTVSGTIGATADEADATALHLRAGASVPTLKVSGTISARGAGTSSTSARAILIEEGAEVRSIRNSGTISAARAESAGTAAAIVDRSGKVTRIENSGTIGVKDAEKLGDSAIAFDVSANTTGVTVRQLAVTGKTRAPSIGGNMLFGTGNDVLDVADGTVVGSAKFDAGNNRLSLSGDATMKGSATFGNGADTVQLSGTSKLTGDIDFGGGSNRLDVTGTSVFQGKLSNTGSLNVNVGAGSTLDVRNTNRVQMDSLTTGTGSTIGVAIDLANAKHTLYDVGTAAFGTDTKINVTLVTVAGAVGTYKIIEADSLTGAENLSSSLLTLPFLFGSSLDTSKANEVSLVIRRKTADELGLNRSEGSALDAVIGILDADKDLAKVFLGANNSRTLRRWMQQMLPDHAGGAFEAVTKGSRLAIDILADPNSALIDRNGWGLWGQQIAWGSSKSIGSTASYDLTGWGAAGGIERKVGAIGNVGLTLAYQSGRDTNDGGNELMSTQYEGGLYWRGGTGPLRGYARATAATINFDGTRQFTGTVDGDEVKRTAEGEWNGRLYSATAGAAYDLRKGRLNIRPEARVEHFTLKEKGYTETGGGDAFNLTVEDRSSSETAAAAAISLGYDILSVDPAEPWMRVEVEGGWRQIVAGSLGKTVARFGNGNPFTLAPEDRTSGWTAGLRLLGGGPSVTLTGEVSAEDQQGEASLGARAGVQIAL